MGRYLLRKLLFVVPTLIGASLVVFIGLRIIPGDPALMMAGDRATPAEVQQLRQELGLNDRLDVQYVRFLTSALQGDFGRSLRTNDKAIDLILFAFPITAELALVTLFLATLFGVVTGTIAAVKQYSLFDNALMISVLIGISVPAFWSGLLLILFLGLFMNLVPISGILSSNVILPRITGFGLVDSLIQGNWVAFSDVAWHLVLPTITLGLGPTAMISRMVRSSVLEVLHEDYMRTARSKGLDERTVIVRHALKNSLIPVVTTVGLQAGYLLSGAVVVEWVFARPGLGWLAITSISFRDYPVVQGIVLLSVLIFVFVNLVADLLYAYLDPRIKYA